MTLFSANHWFAALAIQRMLYCLAEGTALAVVMSAVLRIFPKKNSQTRFAVWFATLMVLVLLPVVGIGFSLGAARSSSLGNSSAHALFTIPTAWAEALVAGWATLAGLGLLRVVASLWQIRQLRRSSVAMDLKNQAPELQELIARFRKSRPVSILVSPTLQVPTALGFWHPAIVVPAWLAEEKASAELKYVLLHEMAHLRRWDDWTNLAQKIVKAVLFFHPGVWWIERKMSLDREMACDDAVLAQTTNPRAYAQCLARVAEKSFLRRQMALAQAAVDRAKQLSARVARIIDGDHPHSTRLWKPALPVVAAVAALCAFSTSSTPELVRFSDVHPAIVASSPASGSQLSNDGRGGADQVVRSTPVNSNAVQVVPVRMKIGTSAKPGIPLQQASLDSAGQNSFSRERGTSIGSRAKLTAQGQFTKPSPVMSDPTVLSARQDEIVNTQDNANAQPASVMVLVVASEKITSGSVTWQIKTWELHLVAPVSRTTKQIPRKT